MFSIRALLITILLCITSSAAGQVSAALEMKAAPSDGRADLTAPRLQPQRAHADADEHCALGEFCVGPVLTLGAVDPIGMGAHLRYGRYFGFGIDYQFLPTRVDLGAASSTWSLFTVEGRVYPFGNAFFVSGGFGYQRFSARTHQMTPIGDVALSGSLAVPALKLGIGFMGHDGFVLGADIGFNFSLGNSDVEFGTPTGPGANYQSGSLALQQEVNDIADQAQSTFPVIPQVNLIRMGYLF